MKICFKNVFSFLSVIMFMFALNFGSVNAQSFADVDSGNCAGGSCKLYRVGGTVKCEACCPSGKNPSCSDLGGCECK